MTRSRTDDDDDDDEDNMNAMYTKERTHNDRGRGVEKEAIS